MVHSSHHSSGREERQYFVKQIGVLIKLHICWTLKARVKNVNKNLNWKNVIFRFCLVQNNMINCNIVVQGESVLFSEQLPQR